MFHVIYIFIYHINILLVYVILMVFQCIYPQEILHGDKYSYKGNELRSEITFPRKKFDKIMKHIKPLKNI